MTDTADNLARQEITPPAPLPRRAVLSARVISALDPAGPPVVAFALGARFGDGLAPYVHATPVEDQEGGAARRALDERRSNFVAELVLPKTQVPHVFGVELWFDDPDALAALIGELRITHAALTELVPSHPAGDPSGL